MPSLTWKLLEHGARGDGLADNDVIPGQHLAAFVEADARAVQVHRAVVAAPHVVLTAPERAHRCVQAGGARGLGDLAGLDHKVAAAREAPAEAAARHLHMDRHLLGLEAQHARDRGAVQTGALAAGPQLGAALGKLNGAVQRLHRRVGEIRKHELRFQLPGRRVERRHVGVELARAGASGQLAVLGELPFAIDLLDGRRVPLQLQGVAALRGLPISVGHDGHAFGATIQRHAQHGLHALDGARRAVVHRGKARAEHRRASDHGRQLTGQANVDTKILLPAALGARVETRSRAADDAEILRVLQRDLLGHRQRHGGLGQFAVTQLAAIRAQHRAGLRAQRGHVHLPARCGGTEQHGPRACAELAILRKTVLDRMGAAGEVNAEERVNVGAVVRAVPAAHQAPVGVEFFRQDHRQCGLHALSELQPVDRHRDFAIGGDLHEGRRLFGRLERACPLAS